MGKREDRVKSLLRIIERRDGVTIKELSVIEGVSELTIRRDVQLMEEKRLVRNVRGTIFCNYAEESDTSDTSYLLSVATNRHRAEKKRNQTP